MSYCEWPEFYAESYPKARKRHRCIECWSPIDIGEEHLYYRGKWDGDFSTGRQHLLCRDMCMSMRSRDQYDECVPFGSMLEEWPEHHASSTENRKHWDDKDRKQRSMMARIKWRKRKHRVHRKRVQGVLMNRPWGMPWQVVQDKISPAKDAT